MWIIFLFGMLIIDGARIFQSRREDPGDIECGVGYASLLDAAG